MTNSMYLEDKEYFNLARAICAQAVTDYRNLLNNRYGGKLNPESKRIELENFFTNGMFDFYSCGLSGKTVMNIIRRQEGKDEIN